MILWFHWHEGASSSKDMFLYFRSFVQSNSSFPQLVNESTQSVMQTGKTSPVSGSQLGKLYRQLNYLYASMHARVVVNSKPATAPCSSEKVSDASSARNLASTLVTTACSIVKSFCFNVHSGQSYCTII